MKSIENRNRHSRRMRMLSMSALAACCLAMTPLAGCSDDDDVSSQMDEAIEEVRDEADDAADEVRKKAEEVKEEIEDEIDDHT